MRKIISLMLVFSILLSLSACGGEEKPDAVVTSFSKAMQKLDFDGMAACLKDGGSGSESPFDDPDQFTAQIIDYLSSAASKMTYSIEKSEINNETATVTVAYTYVDASPIVAAALGEYFQQAFAMALSGADEDTMAQLFGTIFEEKIESVSAGTADVTANFACITTEDGWKIENVPDDALNVMTCNMYSAFDSFDSSFEDDTSNFNNEDVNAEETVWYSIPFGEVVELATINIRLTDVAETKELSSTFSNTTAIEGTKFVLITAEIENITKSPLSYNNDLMLYDDQERSYNAYGEAFWYVDNSFSYVELAPNIKETGTMIYNIPEDATGYFLTIGKAGTNMAYELLTN